MQINGTLENYLKSEIFPQLANPPFATINAAKISHKRPVYVYKEEYSRAKIVGKYFKYEGVNLEEAWHKAEKEYSNLTLLRDQIGMKGNHYNIVAPLGRNKVLSAVLILENAPGENLDHYIVKAIFENKVQDLYSTLSDLARFFARLHRNSDTGRRVSGQLPQWYSDTIMTALRTCLPGFNYQEGEFKSLFSDWWSRRDFFNDHEVIVHGDATPTNFLFHHGKVTGIDLEKMKWADRCWDLGFIAAELKHHMMWRTGNGARAEGFIGHFLWEYAVAMGDTQIFYQITRRLPLYMALGLMRIARNNWLDVNYRYKLIGEATLCLKYKP